LLTRSLPVVAGDDAPLVRFAGLDTVWFQLTGTLCNLACRHCFITCGPGEERVPMMAASQVRAFLDEAERLGAREYYFTGGEPMLHPEFWPLCEDALARGPLTVLTNGILLDAVAAARARALFDAARWSFDLRVSLDGMTAEENDAVRGRGTFAAITAGLAELARAGISPAITVVEHAPGLQAADARTRFLEFARSLGLGRPRVKFLPILRIGREEGRTHGYRDGELDVLHGPLDPQIAAELQCTSSRLVTPFGVVTCPILLDAPEARLADTLAGARRDHRLRWAACRTCVVDGLTCRT
jgi:sulfatase maturation enzyme AslB (radical SAM superfamily)